MAERRDFNTIDEVTCGAQRIAVAGHVHPDGDCAGSVLALSVYLRKTMPQADIRTYLEEMNPSFSFLPGFRLAKKEDDGFVPELLILLDTSTPDRIGVTPDLMTRAQKTVLIDHHVSNVGFGDLNVIVPEASSACEVLYPLLRHSAIDLPCATALYTGLIHDTGLFRYPNTSTETLLIAADLLRYGVPFPEIIDRTFDTRTYPETRILGEAMRTARLFAGGRAIFSRVTEEMMEYYGAGRKDLDAIVAELRKTEGCEAAVFLYPSENGCKASLRSRAVLDVSAVARAFGGGGHLRAAGCTIEASFDEAETMLIDAVTYALDKACGTYGAGTTAETEKE